MLVVALAGCEAEDDGAMIGHKTSAFEGGRVMIIDPLNKIKPFFVTVTTIQEISCPPEVYCLLGAYRVAVFDVAGQTIALSEEASTDFKHGSVSLRLTLVDLVSFSSWENGNNRKAAVFVFEKINTSLQ